MVDPRVTRLAETLVNYSCAVKSGEKILIEAIDVPHEFTAECVRIAHEAGAMPIVWLKSNQINRALMMAGTRDQWNLIADVQVAMMKSVDCYIGARGNPNINELSDVPADKQKIYESTVWKRVHGEVRVPKTRWVVLRWPNSSMAQLAEMSTPGFEDFYFDVCTMDYAHMAKQMQHLKARMDRTDKVRLLGPNDTDLTFSIKGIPAIPCSGLRNIPDGEVFTAPVRDSVNGVIHYNTPSPYRGFTHDDVRLVFREGKIVEATSSASDKLQEIFDTDEGARYVGEFAIGVNPYINKPMKDILFDEKIAGSIHFTPGRAYDEANNGNVSEIHWDMVLIQTPAYGGGEMYFDGELVRKDGVFVTDDLKGLNPDALKKPR
ncbi:MAG: aminopeptidase [Phycisphaerales bacterium]|nr:aminopeptidase [Phycisphaerales bacterium]